MNTTHIIRQYDSNLLYAYALVKDVTEEQMTVVPAKGLVNHPAWTLGHLVSGSAGLAEDFGSPFEMPEGWADLFLLKGPGDPRYPNPDKSLYPSKQELLDELTRQHNKVKNLLNNISEAALNENIKWRFSDQMPTLLDLVTFMCTTHEAMHLGQLAAWRRAMDLPLALATL